MSLSNNAWDQYEITSYFDEALTSHGNARLASRGLVSFFSHLSLEEIKRRNRAAQLTIKGMGVNFGIFSEGSPVKRDWPYDLFPRAITQKKWSSIEKGLIQRSRAINYFLNDIYGHRAILKDGVIPSSLIDSSPNYKKICRGIIPPHGAWAHISGTDLVRDKDGKFLVLEDNLRIPSGVAYMLENREVTKRVLPEMFRNYSVQPVDDYSSRLFKMLESVSPNGRENPNIVVLTPGIFNSAYFEHAHLATCMGVELVEGDDLFVTNKNEVYMKTVEGPVLVDVIYRRVDDEYLDPEVFRSDSVVGVPGLIRSWKSGKVAIVNAPGTGVADDKAIYAFVPSMIRYYLKEEAIIPNVKTYHCSITDDLGYVLDNIKSLVVKPVNASGGYGIMVGPKNDAPTHDHFRRLVIDNPRNYVAQPTIQLSTGPTFINQKLEPRHLDLRPFTLLGADVWVTPGGLTRVALKRGSLVVNSSQGGGSKDTWIVEKMR